MQECNNISIEISRQVCVGRLWLSLGHFSRIFTTIIIIFVVDHLLQLEIPVPDTDHSSLAGVEPLPLVVVIVGYHLCKIIIYNNVKIKLKFIFKPSHLLG